MPVLPGIVNVINSIKDFSNNHVDKFGAQYLLFGVFGVINYPIYYLIWIYAEPESYESFLLRLAATLLCLPLIFNHYWPKILKSWLPVYWHITICFCLPFFFSFMLLMNNFASSWLMSSTIVLAWLIFLVDWLVFVILSIIGVSAAALAFYFIGNNNIIGSEYLFGIFSQYAGSILVLILFARNKQLYDRKKQQILADFGDKLAHEIRTPLASLSLNIANLKQSLPTLKKGFNLAIDHQLLPNENRIEENDDIFSEMLEIMARETKSANLFIDMFLIKVKKKHISHEKFSATACISEAVKRYPFKQSQKAWIKLNTENDFIIHGNCLMTIHVIFNLIRNALHYVANVENPEISIYYEQTTKYNIIHVKDNGEGIKKENISKIFNKFYSKSPHGTGIGLSYCKEAMESMNGKIDCQSIYGKFTDFSLYFPHQHRASISGEKT